MISWFYCYFVWGKKFKVYEFVNLVFDFSEDFSEEFRNMSCLDLNFKNEKSFNMDVSTLETVKDVSWYFAEFFGNFERDYGEFNL